MRKADRLIVCLVLGVCAGTVVPRALDSPLVADETPPNGTLPLPSGNAVIRGRAGPSDIVITTTGRLAGAIHSLTWNGKEFIDSADHGRQLQSAASLDCAKPGEFWAECYNPTEAGSCADGAGQESSSKLLRLRAQGAELETATQMAFWLAPGETSSGRPALNDAVLSRHLVKKHVRIGYDDLPHVIDYEVVFTVPPGERHTCAQFKALTGYMPPEFESFRKYNVRSGKLDKLDDGPGEQAWPVVFATRDGSHAMGVFSPDQPSPGYEEAGYGRFRFLPEKVVKWNCVFRLRQEKGIAAGDYRFRAFVAVGTLGDVSQSLDRLVKKLPLPSEPGGLIFRPHSNGSAFLARSPAVNIDYVPLLEIQRRLYDLPRGRDRFREYLRTMTDGSGLELPPLVTMNPMAREHVPALLDELLAIDADAVAARAVTEATTDLAETPGDFKVGLVIADDLKGGWTNRYANEFTIRFENPKTTRDGIQRPAWSSDVWITGVLWSSESVSTPRVREAVLTAVYRTAYLQRRSSAEPPPFQDLSDRMAQEGWVMAKAGCTEPTLDDEELAYTREVLAPFLDARDMRTTVECLFGDVAARTLGFTPRGLSPWAGLALALDDARHGRRAHPPRFKPVRAVSDGEPHLPPS